jgi:SAM-dependent methyltransferase
VCELGNQTLKNAKQRRTIYKRLGLKGVEPVSVREWYLSMGFSDYTAIDVNQDKDAVAMDLNLDLKHYYNYTEQFDLVTNNGTGEHVFNQLNVFKNAHDLCKPTGCMIHCLPCFRWLDHGFYNFNPNLFTALATANGYKLSHLWLAQNNCDALHELDPTVLHRVETMRGDLFLDTWERDISIVAILWKNSTREFAVPIQQLYGGDNIDSQEISDRYKG